MSDEGRPSSGLFVTLYDEHTLNLYLEHGVYGFLMPLESDEISQYSRHYAALADYACGRDGTHVFFFLKRRIVYGGQLVGSRDQGCFYINGPLSPMGVRTNAKLCWDESVRERYEATDKPGVFKVQTKDGIQERCQPYLIRFEDRVGFRGKAITSDDFYFELGGFGYPLPTNSIQGMGFCTMTPGEVDILVRLLQGSSDSAFQGCSEEIELDGQPLHFYPEYGIRQLTEASSESHLEASIIANPGLLPSVLDPRGSTVCRQVPMSPLKPYQMDKADICYYSDDPIQLGTIPNMVIELKKGIAGKNEMKQVLRYIMWLRKLIPSEFERIQFCLFAPSFTRTVRNELPADIRSQVRLEQFGEQEGDFEQEELPL